jgi:FMN phosphatase YigB (HAD superfamily)
MQPRTGVLETLITLRDAGHRLGMITNGWTNVQNATINDGVGELIIQAGASKTCQ